MTVADDVSLFFGAGGWAHGRFIVAHYRHHDRSVTVITCSPVKRTHGPNNYFNGIIFWKNLSSMPRVRTTRQQQRPHPEEPASTIQGSLTTRTRLPIKGNDKQEYIEFDYRIANCWRTQLSNYKIYFLLIEENFVHRSIFNLLWTIFSFFQKVK